MYAYGPKQSSLVNIYPLQKNLLEQVCSFKEEIVSYIESSFILRVTVFVNT
jgi:hypothetical protein